MGNWVRLTIYKLPSQRSPIKTHPGAEQNHHS